MRADFLQLNANNYISDADIPFDFTVYYMTFFPCGKSELKELSGRLSENEVDPMPRNGNLKLHYTFNAWSISAVRTENTHARQKKATVLSTWPLQDTVNLEKTWALSLSVNQPTSMADAPALGFHN